MKKKRAQARRPKVRKPQMGKPEPPELQTCEPAASKPVPPEPCCDDGALSIEAMLRAQLVETHLAAMDCLRRARAGESPELRDRALTHATRLLSLFGRQVNALERRRPPPTTRPAGAADTAEWTLADAAAKALADLAAEIAADDPPDGTDPLPGGGENPARHDGAGDSAEGGP